MADYEALLNAEKKKNAPSPTSAPQEGKSKPEKADQTRTPSTHRLTNQSTKQLTGQSSDRSIDQSTHSLHSRIVEKPKAFYITERVNKRLDEAVRYFQEKHGIKKVDRSTLVNVFLDNDANWTEEALDVVVDRVIRQLTSRLTNR